MTEATEDGDSSSPGPASTDKPPPAAERLCLLGLALPPLYGSGTATSELTLPVAADLPVAPGVCLVLGLGIAFTGSLIENALHKFSPALLLMRADKQNGDPAPDGETRELEEELQNAERYLPPAVLLEFGGVGVALVGALALFGGGLVWPSGWAGIVLFFVLTVLFCGVLPSRITDFRAESIVSASLPALRVLRILGLPLTAPVSKLSSFFVRNVLGIREELEQASDRETLADEIRAAVEDSDETEALADEEKEWIENIVQFRNEDAAGIMTPRTDMVGVESAKTFREAVKIAVEAGHSRLPVFDQKMDDIIGIFYLRDAVGWLTDDAGVLEKPVSGYMRQAFFVPESKRVSDLLQEFKARRVQIAVVVDEYGGTAGLVSIEDILEEIVGEIEDEYDPEHEEALHVLEGGRLAEIDAKVRTGDVNEVLGTALPESEDYETIGGFVFSHLGRIPRTGESFQYGNVELTVVSADARRILRLKVRVLEARARA